MNQDQHPQYFRSACKRQRLDQPSNGYHFPYDPKFAGRNDDSTWAKNERNCESSSNSDNLASAEQWTPSSRSSHSNPRDNHYSRGSLGDSWNPSSSRHYSHLSEENNSWPAIGVGQVAQVPGPDQVCFGMLEGIAVHNLQSKSLDPRAPTIPVSLDTLTYPLQLLATQDDLIGSLDIVHSKLLGILNQEPRLQLQTFITASPSQKTTSKIKPQNNVAELSAILYGPLDIFDSIGEFLSRCRKYLQPPLHCDYNVPYRNPQSLAGREWVSAKAVQHEDNNNLKCETLVQDPDPSAILENERMLTETNASAAVRTTLYSHQKQALSFMLGRERSWNLCSNDYDIWKAVRMGPKAATSDQNSEIPTFSTAPFQGGILADSMGLGKSLSVISLLASDYGHQPGNLAQSINVTPTLLIVPLSLLKTWEEELSRHLDPGTLTWWRYHASGPSADWATVLSNNIIITTYDVVSMQWRNAEEKIQPLFSITWNRIVLDEAHEIRTGTSQRAKAVCALRGNARWAVTGTPIQNRLDDLASLLGFLRAFPERDIRDLKTLLRSGTAITQIKRLLTSICLRRSKKILSLPERLDRIHVVKFDEDEQAEYNRVNHAVINDLQLKGMDCVSGSCPNILAKINSLRQICNIGTSHSNSQSLALENTDIDLPAAQEIFDSMISTEKAICSMCLRDLASEDKTEYPHLQGINSLEDSQAWLTSCFILVCSSCYRDYAKIGVVLDCHCLNRQMCKHSLVSTYDRTLSLNFGIKSRLPAKMRRLQKDLAALPLSDKCIIFSFWTSTLNVVEVTLEQSHFPFTRVDGAMPQKQRQDAIKTFREEPRIRAILISLHCGANGLNLTAANHVFLMEPQWNPMLEDQALDRVYRIGQTKTVTTVRYVVEGTIEESIRHQQSYKRSVADQALNPSETGKDDIQASLL